MIDYREKRLPVAVLNAGLALARGGKEADKVASSHVHRLMGPEGSDRYSTARWAEARGACESE